MRKETIGRLDRPEAAAALEALLEAGLADPGDRQRLLALGTSRFAAAAGLITLDVPPADPGRSFTSKRAAFPEETRVEAWLAFALPAAAVGDILGRRLFEGVVVPLAGMLGESVYDAGAAAIRIASCIGDRPDAEVVQVLEEELGAAAAAPMAHPALSEVAAALRALSSAEASASDLRRNPTEALPA